MYGTFEGTRCSSKKASRVGNWFSRKGDGRPDKDNTTRNDPCCGPGKDRPPYTTARGKHSWRATAAPLLEQCDQWQESELQRFVALYYGEYYMIINLLRCIRAVDTASDLRSLIEAFGKASLFNHCRCRHHHYHITFLLTVIVGTPACLLLSLWTNSYTKTALIPSLVRPVTCAGYTTLTIVEFIRSIQYTRFNISIGNSMAWHEAAI